MAFQEWFVCYPLSSILYLPVTSLRPSRLCGSNSKRPHTGSPRMFPRPAPDGGCVPFASSNTVAAVTHRRKIALASFAALAVVALLLWPRLNHPTYERRAVGNWFKRYDEIRNKSFYDAIRGNPGYRSIFASPAQPTAPGEMMRVESAFKAMGTNAVLYLVSCITRDLDYSRAETWRIKLRWRVPQILKGLLPLPASKGSEAWSAAVLLSDQIKPPGEMLLPLLEPALRSTNAEPRLCAFIALIGSSSGHELTRPYLLQGLKDSDSQVQKFAANVVRRFGPHGKWAVTNLLEVANSPVFETHEAALHALNIMGTNAWPVVPQLKEMLAKRPTTKDAR